MNYKEKLVRLLLTRLLIISLINILIYLLYDISVGNSQSYLSEFVTLSIYLTIFIFHIRGANPNIIKNIVVFFSYQAVLLAFFLIGGLSQIAILDFYSLAIMIVMFYSGNVRGVLLGLFFTIIGFLFVVQFTHPEWILNSRTNDPSYIQFLTFLCRIFTGLIVTDIVKREFELKSELLEKNYKELDELNLQISSQYFELEEKNHEISTINEQLEIKVNERTAQLKSRNKQISALLYMNSHLLRAPIARLLGIHQFSEMEKDVENASIILESYKSSVVELDEITKKINLSIEENMDYSIEEINEAWEEFQTLMKNDKK
ncbi:MAG: hypothetical protein SFY32_15810 [Bacteroidota bacterium]|nr:hypothetical protein [Bacteroidota bacterium]